MAVRLLHATAGRPGAIAILQLIGDVVPILRALTGIGEWPLHVMRLVQFAGIDEGLAVRLTPDVAQLMPHGGPRVLQRLTQTLLAAGAELISNPIDGIGDPQLLYPEASDRFEALMLAALARAQSPLAIDLLLDQPRRWREFIASGDTLSTEDRLRAQRLNRLIDPPMVVLAGQPNVGKSTLSNALLGRSMSIAYDMPGTTRDYTAGWIDLAGLVVSWHDTPGMRRTNDPIEQRAIELAARLIMRSDLLVAMTDPEHDWPTLPREPDARVLNKIDLSDHERPSNAGGGALCISAKTGEGLPGLVAALRDRLISAADLAATGPWLFDRRLIQA